jgi:type IV pilus assembly protein PilY1
MTRTMHAHQHAQRLRPRAITLALLTLLQAPGMPAWAAATAPSQKPLISKSTQPAPNVMLTLDTSGSMNFPYIPEGTFQVSGSTVRFPESTSVIIHPKDPAFLTGYGPSYGDGGVVTSDPNQQLAPLFQMQMRSPDVNGMYYDPRVRYKPWLMLDSATNTLKRYPDAKATMAFFDPDKATATDPKAYADLTDISNLSPQRPHTPAPGVVAHWCANPPIAKGHSMAGRLDCGQSPSSRPFNPGLYYILESGTLACPGATPNPNIGSCYKQYDINLSGATFPKHPNRDDCTSTTCSQEQERQNFANWFVYYRTRMQMAQAAVPETFLALDDNKLRLGWGGIHQGETVVQGQKTKIVASGVQLLDAKRKAELSTWIRSYKSPNGGTPLRTALMGVGAYFARSDAAGPWATDPSNPARNEPIRAMLACRRAYNVLITDGYYNDSDSDITVGNVDGTDGPDITGPNDKPYKYLAGGNLNKLYSDTKPNTLADVAMAYWKNDLQGHIDNRVPAGSNVPGQDPAFWQHLVQMPIALGVTGSVPNDSMANLLSHVASKGWWSAADVSTQRVDDLLHAAINTRGQYFSAKRPSELTNALTKALNRAARRHGLKQAGVATALTTIGGNNVKYVPEYTTEQWTGDLSAYATDSSGNWSTAPKWKAADHLPPPALRNIVTSVDAGGSDFLWPSGSATSTSSLDTSSQALLTQSLPGKATGQQLVDYIRGDSTQEDSADTLRLFRQRESKLGDFINSQPLVLQGKLDLRYDLLPANLAPSGSYSRHLAAKAKRDRLIIAGANDGMLHAFAGASAASCAGSGVTSPPSCGQEVFAYIPKAALTKLGKVAQRDYGDAANPHQLLVDGPTIESDAYLSGKWKNIIVGTMGGGGTAIFALDFTPGGTLNKSSVMWEISSADHDDFGYMMGDAQVGVKPDGSWTVFVGNGPYSQNGRAALMMIDLASGKVTSIPTSNTDSGNGLGAVRLVKDSYQQVVGVYAGDLKGRLWHFDVSSTAAIATNLFAASTSSGLAQPITAAPNALMHPKGGHMVTFGTGKLIDDTDSDDAGMQTLYGVWHKPSSIASTPPKLTRTDLVEQVIIKADTAGKTVAPGRSYHSLRLSDVDYAHKWGWYIDLTQAAGQRVIYPQTPLKNFVLFNTVVPVTTAQSTSCENNGQGFSWVLPALMDGTHDKALLLDTSGDGVVSTDSDVQAFGYSTDADGRSTVLTGGNQFSDQHSQGKQHGAIPGGWKRVWRQLITTPRP